MQAARRWFGCMLGAGVLAGLAAAPAAADKSPPLTEPQSALAKALECSPGLSGAAKTPVLLVHGTGSNPEETWSWGYRAVLPTLGIPTCTVKLPDRAFVDIQHSVEYTVSAIRSMYGASGREISVLGHSQGGIHPVWALRFFPDVRPMIDDVIAMGTAYQGTEGGHLLPCASSGCPPSVWQQTQGSKFIAALNRKPIPSRPDYSSIATRFDQVSYPQPESSRLPGAREILIQDICPTRPTDHFYLPADAAAYGIVIDALEHSGPADPARVDPVVCSQIDFAGVDRVEFAQVAPTAASLPLVTGVDYDKQVTSEPPLRCYADPACGATATTRCSGAPVNRRGTPTSDRLVGTPRRDGFLLLAGNDKSRGRAGRDALCGGQGRDKLIGGRGRDRLRGNGGADKLVGGPGRDVLVGGPGRDNCIGGRQDALRSC